MIEGVSLGSQKAVVLGQLKPSSGIDLAKQFDAILNAAIDNTQEQKAVTNQLTTDFITGDLNDIHKLVLESEKAAIGLELTVQVRNKVIEAYQEIMRMQI